MKTLGIDVCSGFCSVAIVGGDILLAMKHEPMTRGHAERLAPMVVEVLADASISAVDLDGIAVTTGPGSFTGARLGVSFARGLAMAVDVPAVGVSIFEALAPEGGGLIVLDGKQGTFLVQRCSENRILTGEPVECDVAAAINAVPANAAIQVTGPAGQEFLTKVPHEFRQRAVFIAFDPVTSDHIARIGAEKIKRGQTALPAPLYLRPPDAKPQAVVALT